MKCVHWEWFLISVCWVGCTLYTFVWRRAHRRRPHQLKADDIVYIVNDSALIWSVSNYRCQMKIDHVWAPGPLVGHSITHYALVGAAPLTTYIPDSKVLVAHMGPTWVLSALCRAHVGPCWPMNLAVRDVAYPNTARDTKLWWRHSYIHRFSSAHTIPSRNRQMS